MLRRSLGALLAPARSSLRAFASWPTPNLAAADPEAFKIIKAEEARQKDGITLIPSENYASTAVLQALGSCLTNKYSEGYPGARYYGGNEQIDNMERLCHSRAMKVFGLNSAQWGVNVQTLSGSPANFAGTARRCFCRVPLLTLSAVYTGLLKPYDRIMSLDLPDGGHLSHGYQIPGKKISAVSVYFETLPYRLDPATGYINYEKMEELALLYRPKLIVAGTSAYSRLIDYKRVRAICDSVGAIMLADMAHISGLVAAGTIPSPFQYADIVTTTTHKTLRGPRGGMIFYKKGTNAKGEVIDHGDKINWAVFPGLQGGPHNHTIAALTVALHEAQSEDFKQNAVQTIVNCKAFAAELVSRDFKLVSGGTDNHLVLADLRGKGLDGSRAEKVLELVNISCNKNTVPGDKSAMTPSGLRMGTPAITTRGMKEREMKVIADFVHRGIGIAQDIKAKNPGNLKVFTEALAKGSSDIDRLRDDVSKLSRQFPVPSFSS